MYFERECTCTSGGGAESRRDRIPSRLPAISTEPDKKLELKNCKIGTWAEIESQMLNRLYHPGVPKLFFFFFFLVYLFLRARERVWGRGREKGRENPWQTLGIQFGAQCRAWSQDCEIMTWAKKKSQTLSRLSHPGSFEVYFSISKCFKIL